MVRQMPCSPKDIRMPKSSRHRSTRPSRSRGAAPAVAAGIAKRQGRPDTKQARVLALLRSPSGVTVAAISEQTGWQPHSVRGFLAGVVRKRLKLKLLTDLIDGQRIYRIEDARGRRRT